MRRFSLHLLCMMLLAPAFSQTSVQQKNTTPRWDLDSYVWSHTHYKTGKNDKPALDFDALDKWPLLGGQLSVSRNGGYIAFTLNRGNKYPGMWKKDSLIIQSTTNSWRRSFIGVDAGFFSTDSRQYIYKDKEALCFIKLNSTEVERIDDVALYKVPADGKNEWLAYKLKNNQLVLQHLANGRKKTFDSVIAFNFDKSCTWLACQLNNKDLQLHYVSTGKELSLSSVISYVINEKGTSLVTKNNEGELSFTDLVSTKTVAIWKPAGTKQALKEFKMDGSGSQVVFSVEDANKDFSIWYWKKGMDKAVVKVNNQTQGIDDNLLQSTVAFTDSDRYIQFSLKPRPDTLKPMDDAVQLDIWSYQDKTLQSMQEYLLKKPVSYRTILNPDNGSIIRLEKEQETIHLLQGDFAVIKKKGSEVNGDRFWQKDNDKDSNWLVSLKDGIRYLLPARGKLHTMWFSPGGRYLVYFDADLDYQYFSYDLATHRIAKISTGAPLPVFRMIASYQRIDSLAFPVGIAGWLEGDTDVLVFDNYDIWQLDLSGKRPAINLTNGYGVLHNTIFNIMSQEQGLGRSDVFSKNQALLLIAFNKQTKYNGYYKKLLGTKGDPEPLYMGPCLIQKIQKLELIPNGGMAPQKAANVNVWIVQKETPTDAPNYFLTKDFKTYKRLTNIQPQNDYNWLTTELHSFKQLDGVLTQGVLYKPANFDSTKKYPVIISFYGNLSDRLYQFPSPECLIYPTIFDQPAWMVSHGYLVFLPDLYFTKGQWGPSVVNMMDGAAKYLSRLPYVDGKRIGAAGHSNSGRFGYYLLTHSNAFAAMSIGAGVTNVISKALALGLTVPNSLLAAIEVETYGTGLNETIWENKEKWLDHSAVLQADKATSPVLMFHNKNDGAFRPGSALEMYLSLWRLEKEAWWLQYDQGAHYVGFNDAKDFTIRYTQFFDHYLKGAPKPYWMQKSIPLSLKGIKHGYELGVE